jgi:hypothetical protein
MLKHTGHTTISKEKKRREKKDNCLLQACRNKFKNNFFEANVRATKYPMGQISKGDS